MKIRAVRALCRVELTDGTREAASELIAHLPAGESTAGDKVAIATHRPVVSDSMAEFLDNQEFTVTLLRALPELGKASNATVERVPWAVSRGFLWQHVKVAVKIFIGPTIS